MKEDFYYKEVLENGCVIILEELPQFMSTSIGLCLRIGSRYEQKNERGISHFIEHLLFKGTKNRTAKEISREIDSIGGILNASCGKEFTCFYAKVVDKDLIIALDVLIDMLTNSLFKIEDIEKERTVIFEEIKSVEDNPSDYIFDLYLKSVWGDHPLAITTSGDKETILSFHREQILDYFHKYYTTEQIIISLAGNINHNKALDFLKEKLGKLSNIDPYKKAILSKPVFNSGININYKDCEQVHICIGYPGIPLGDKSRYKALILDNILGGTASSRLFQKIREELGFVYSIYSFQNAFLDIGLFSFYVATSVKNIEKVIKNIIKELDEICVYGITDDELDVAKNYIKGGLILSLESTSNRMFRIAKSELVYNRVIPIKEIIQEIDLITREDILDLARYIFNRDNIAICMLGPLEENRDFSNIF